jgi:hypothetical protein
VGIVRKVLILTVLVLLVCSALALAGWQVSRWVTGGSKAPSAGSLKPGIEGNKDSTANGSAKEPGGTEVTGAGTTDGAGAPVTAEATSSSDPGQRYVTETQRHQNFFKALAEGRIKRLDVTSTDFQPAGDPHTSYVYFVIATTDGARSDGSFVMKYEGGLWRIAAVRISGSLSGGTDYVVPDSFEADLARELQEQQDFLTKVAEGRLAYMSVDSVTESTPGQTVLRGKVASKGGSVYPADMTLRKDYDVWHLTNIVAL